MAHPIITEAGNHVILTYELQSIAALSRATDQVYSVLKAVSKRDEFFSMKKATVVKIDRDSKNDKAIRMHFIIPSRTINHAVLESILQAEQPAV